MARKIYLNGEMASKFGTVHPFVGDTVQDAIRLINANNPEFRPYLFNCMEEDIGFSITVHGKELEDGRELLLPLREGDIIITPIAAGSGSGKAKILTAALIAFTLMSGGIGGALGLQTTTAIGGTGTIGATGISASLGTVSSGQSIFAAAMAQGGVAQAAASAAMGLAANLAYTGIAQIMAPDPAVDKEEEKGYMLSGSQQNIVEGDPVPVLYGELRVPGKPISFEVKNHRTRLVSEFVTTEESIVATILSNPSQANTSQEGATLSPYAGTHGTDGDWDFANSLESFVPGTNPPGVSHPEADVMNTTYVDANMEVFGKSQDMLITDVISEGPIKGLVNGSASVYLNDDPAEDLGQSAKSLFGTSATFTMTNGSTTVTYNPNTTEYTIPQTTERRYLHLRESRNATGATTVYQAVLSDGSLGGIKVTSPTNIFEESMEWDRRNPHRSTFVRLSSNDSIIFEGFIETYVSDKVAYFKPLSYNMPTGWVDGTDYKIIIDDALPFSTVSEDGLTITLESAFTGTTGTYKADITGVDRDIAEVQKGVGPTVKYEGFSLEFRHGGLDQVGFPNNEGLGIGNVAIGPGSGFDPPAIEGPDEGSSANEYTFQGTNESGFGLSATQAEEVDEIRLLFSYSSMINTSGNNNRHPGNAYYTIKLAFYNGSNWGDWIDRYSWDTETLTGAPLHHVYESQGAVAAEEIISLDLYKPFTDFKIKVERLSESDKAYETSLAKGIKYDGYTSNTACTISNLTSIIKENLSYPLTAMTKVTVNSKPFNSAPKRTYHCKGLKVLVPSNYVTRDESDTGIANYNRHVSTRAVESSYQPWDGNFRDESVYTNNPAWIFYDIITHNRYGLGAWLDGSDIDKFALYRIARYCDEMVPDGDGGTEPRFTTNVYFQKATDAYKVLKDLATTFRGMLYWLDGNIFPVMDEPKDPVYNFSAGNVINGEFSYESTGSKTRSNQVVVTWVNPEEGYKQEALLVEDRENIISTGRIINEAATAFGATTEGQATRYGRWKLWTAKNQTDVASFSTSINAAFLAPGDIVNIQDAARSPSKVQFSGRITGTPSTTVIPLDRPVALIENSTYELSILIEKPGIFLTQQSAVIDGETKNKGDLLLVDKDGNAITEIESEAVNLVDDSGDPITIAWQPYTRVESQPVSTGHGVDIESLTVSPAFTEAPSVSTIWALKETTAEDLELAGSKKPYKILSITENNDFTHNITAVEHYNDKFIEVDEDFILAVTDPVFPAISPSDPVPAPLNAYVVLRDSNAGGVRNDVTLYWDAPIDPTKLLVNDPEDEEVRADPITECLYQHVSRYEISHNVIGLPSPLNVTKDQTSASGMDVLPGTYTLGVRTVNTRGMRSPYTSATFTISDPANENVPRGYGIPIGGTISRHIFLTDTTHKFRLTNASYKFASAGAPQVFVEPSDLDSNNIQDCSNIASVNYSAISGGNADYDRKLASHYIFFDESDTSHHLKLIKYVKDTTLGIDYWYDTGAGTDLTSTNFQTKIGTVAVAANSSTVEGTLTEFTEDYVAGDLIRFGTTKAARVSYVASDTDIRIDRIFTTAINATTAHSVGLFKIDKNKDAVIAMVRHNLKTWPEHALTTITAGGVGYTSAPAVTFSDPPITDPPGTTATGTATITSDEVIEVTAGSFVIGKSYIITSAGTTDFTLIGADDSAVDTIFTATGVGTGTGTANQGTGTVTAITITNAGSGYTGTPTITFAGGGGTGATAVAQQLIFELLPWNLIVNTDLNANPRLATLEAAPEILSFDGESPPALNEDYDNLILTALAAGFDNPEFKITGAGFSQVSGSDEEDTFTGDGTNIYVLSMNPVTAHSTTNLVFTVTIRDADDPTNTTKTVTKTITIPFIRDGSATGAGPPGQSIKNVSIYKLNDDTLTSNTFGTYANPLFEAEAGWQLTPPDIGTVDGNTIWRSDRIFTDDGEDPHQTTWSAPVKHLVYTIGGPGLGSITVQLSRTSVNIPALYNGDVVTDGYVNSGTKIYVWEGNSAREYDGSGTSDGTWTVSAAGTRITPSSTITDSGDFATVGDHSSITDDTAFITYTITGKREDGSALPVTTIEQHFVKVRYGQGNTGPDGMRHVTGFLYQRKNTLPGTAPTAPSGNRYTFATGLVSNGTGSGITPPHATNPPTATDTWHNDSIEHEATSSDTWWVVRYIGIETEASNDISDAYMDTVTYGTPSPHITFDGVVTFTNDTTLAANDGTGRTIDVDPYLTHDSVMNSINTNSTTIDGDQITTGSISLAQLNLAGEFPSGNDAEPADDLYKLSNKIGGMTLGQYGIEGAQGTSIMLGASGWAAGNGVFMGSVNNSVSPNYFSVGNFDNNGDGDGIKWDPVTDGGTFTISGTIEADTFKTALNLADIPGLGGRVVRFGEGTQLLAGHSASSNVNTALLAKYTGNGELITGIIGVGGRAGVAGSSFSTHSDSGGVYGQHTETETGDNRSHWGWLGHTDYGLWADTGKINGVLTTVGNLTGTSATFSTTLGVTGEITASGNIDGTTADFSGAVGVGSLTLNSRSLYINDAGLSFPSYSTSAVGEVLKVASRSGNVIGLEWAAESGGGGGASVLNDLTDVSTSGLASGKVLKYNGSSWVPQDDEGTTYTGTAPIVVSGTAITFAGTSAQVAAGVSDETGSGALVFATSPTLVTPALGTPASGNLANCTFPTLNQSTTQNAGTATKLATARTIGMSGDVVWTSTGFDGSGNVSGTATIQANSVALGTDTTGNYMSAITQGTGVTVTHTPGEGSSGAIAIGQAVATTNNVQFNAIGVNEANTTQGTITATGTITGSDVTADSDIRLKSDVHTIENALDKVSNMRGVTYIKDFVPGSGVIAQELEEIAPELVKENKYKSVAYGNLVGYLIEAIKELKDKVEELENGNSSD